MKSFFKNYHLEFLTGFLFAMAVLMVCFVPQPSVNQKILVVYMFLYCLHEWEETRFPGGFEQLMEGLLGKQFSDDSKKLSRIPVMILLIAIHCIPFLLDDLIILTLIPLCLALFEGFVHTMGVKLSHAEQFYTPGMVTAYCLFAFSIGVICYFNHHGIAAAKDYAIATLCTWACFAVMQNRVLAINGVTYRDIFNVAKSKIHK